MKRKTAVSETISYDTGNCSICETEVALDGPIPNDVMQPKAYAVIIGEGELSKTAEQDGNWDFELALQLDEKDKRHPNVSGFLICEQCAKTIHEHPDHANHYHGKIPSEIAAGSSFDEKKPETNPVAAIIISILLVVMLILVIFL